MNIKFVLPALLVLCGAAYVSPVHAIEYRCMVFSGADGGKPEASSNPDGKYAIKAADPKAAEAGALAAATRYKKGAVTLTKAQCDVDSSKSSAAASAPATTTTAPAPAAAPAPAPAGGAKTMYCAVYDGNEFVDPPAAYSEEKNIWKVAATSIQASEDEAVALAKAQGMNADSAMCAGSVASLKNP